MDEMNNNNDNNRRSREVNKEKGFYSINLTPERIFIVFIVFVVVIAAIIITAAFIFSNSSKNSGDEIVSDNTAEITNDFDPSDIIQEDLSTDDQSENVNSPKTLTDSASNPDKADSGSPETKEQDVVKLNDESVYSSGYNKPEKTKVNNSQPVNKQPVATEKAKNTQTVKATEKKPAVKTESPAPSQKTIETKPKTVTTQTTAKTSPANAKQKQFVVQIGSFSNKKSADAIYDFYKNAGYPVYTKEFVKDGKTFYRLRVGPFSEKTKAQEYLTNLKNSKYGKDSYLTEGVF